MWEAANRVEVALPCSTALTVIAVAGEDGIKMAAEAPARVRDLAVAAAAQADDGRLGPAAGRTGLAGEFQQRSV